MSVFDNADDKTTVPADETIESYVEKLVAEKGETWKDPEVIAKGKYESDRFISDLQRQIAELQKDMEESSKVDELMQMVKDLKAEKPIDGEKSLEKTHDETSPELDAEKLKALIESHVSERETQTTRQKNLAEADKVLMEKYGESAGRTLSARAAELGMTVDELKEQAARNPKAFFRLIGIDAPSAKDSTLVGTTKRSEAGVISDAGKRNFAYYQNLRRENKSKYHSVAVQSQMFKDKEAMGPAFFGN
jgi:hypothetical protein